jgi:hypothetical protein
MALTEQYPGHAGSPDGPYIDGFAVTPSDTVDLAEMASALYIGGAGSGALRITTARGNTLNFAGLTANTVLRVKARRVHSTGTNVTSIVALV